MNEIEHDLLLILNELETTAKNIACTNPKPNLLPLFARIDTLARQLPPDTEPMLFHYLRQKSYAKARLFLAGRDKENVAGNSRE